MSRTVSLIPARFWISPPLVPDKPRGGVTPWAVQSIYEVLQLFTEILTRKSLHKHFLPLERSKALSLLIVLLFPLERSRALSLQIVVLLQMHVFPLERSRALSLLTVLLQKHFFDKEREGFQRENDGFEKSMQGF